MGVVSHYVGIFSDVTERRAEQEKMEAKAHYDELTGLPNRALFAKQLSKTIQHADRQQKKLAICFLDLDGFKSINDNFGHEIGDILLTEVAQRLRASIRSNDLISRQGGDDFGTGYSSLSHIRNLPVNVIKIDQTFVRDLLEDPSDYSIIRGVIELADIFDRAITAEGVETEEQGLMLILMGCEKAQGFFIAKPMPSNEIGPWLEQYIPNNVWLSATDNILTAEQQKLVVLGLTTRYWYQDTVAILSQEHDVDAYPTQCHLGRWLNRIRKDQDFDLDWTSRMQAAHDDLFNEAMRLVDIHRSGKFAEVKKELQTLKSAYHTVKTILHYDLSNASCIDGYE